jgi:CIC family chloride channel protein
MKLRSYIRVNNDWVHPDMLLGQLVTVVTHTPRELFPVVEDDGRLAGIIKVEDLREIMFKTELYANTLVRSFMKSADEAVDINESMQAVVDRFEASEVNELPVTENGFFSGFIAKSDVLAGYRNKLIRQTKELS